MRFGIGMNTDHTLEEVGQQFSVTRERIRQIEAKALRKLKHPSRRKLGASSTTDGCNTSLQAIATMPVRSLTAWPSSLRPLWSACMAFRARRSTSWIVLILLCLTLGLAPFRPEPHIWEKLPCWRRARSISLIC